MTSRHSNNHSFVTRLASLAPCLVNDCRQGRSLDSGWIPVAKHSYRSLRGLNSRTFCFQIEAVSFIQDAIRSGLDTAQIPPCFSTPDPCFKGIPNTAIQNKPLLIYHSAFQGAGASQIESHLSSVGVVSPQWRYTMYYTTHFHSTTHEVLSIISGRAKLCFGGEENSGRVEPVLGHGDVIVVPAGVGHRLLEDHGGFEMVGSYPTGKTWDMCYGKAGEEEKVKAIEKAGWFDRDPVYGKDGPTLEV